MTMALALFVGSAIAAPVSVEQAQRVALKYMQGNFAKQVTSLNLALNTPGGVDYISHNAVTVIVTILPEEFVNLGGRSGESQ